MKVIEGNVNSLLNKFPLLLDTESIKSIGIAWLFKDGDKWCFKPRLCGNDSLYYNGVLFLRLSLPFGVFASVRWSDSTTSKALLQCGLGWKLNGRFAILFRVQSDKTSVAGVSGPNYGQATGFQYGTH